MQKLRRKPTQGKVKMNEKQMVALVEKYIRNHAPQGAPLEDIASPDRQASLDVVPFYHLGFVWIHQPSFRKWLGQSGLWVSQKVLTAMFKKRGWIARQGVRSIPINLWAISVEAKEAERRHV